MKKQDLLTKEEFIPTRSTMKFKTSQNRIKFHNIKAKQLRESISHITKPIHQNLKILNELMSNSNEAAYHKQFLLGRGFTFGVHTTVEVYNNKNQYALFNYIIVPIENDLIKIIKND
jgi:hypothetical protein